MSVFAGYLLACRQKRPINREFGKKKRKKRKKKKKKERKKRKVKEDHAKK